MSNLKNAVFTVYLYEILLARVVITPEIAKFLLENHNKKNREIKESTVAKYTRDMRMGRWKYNGEVIIFDRNGNLMSGQHRLLACIASGVSFVTNVQFGIEPDTRDTVDTGVSRSAADAIRLTTGDKTAGVKVKIVNGIKKIINPHRDAMSVGLAEEMMADFEKGLTIVTSLVKSKGKGPFARAPFAAAFALAATAYPTKTKELLTSLMTGKVEGVTAGALFNYVVNNGFNGDTEDEISSKTLDAIYCHFQGIERQRLQAKKATPKEEALNFFLNAIKEKRDLNSLQYFAPKYA